MYGRVLQEFGFINDIENMSLGEYTDLDTYVTDWNNMHKTMAVLYRPLITRYKDKYTIAEYEGTSEFAEVMKFMPLDVALGSLVFFYRLGNELLQATRQFLVQEVEGMASQEQFAKRWGWYNSIYALAKGDVTKFNTVTKLPISQAFTYLSYESEKVQIEREQLNKSLKG